MGIMATAGMSPRPTDAPRGSIPRGIPKELMPRGNLQYPPAPNWCGLIDGEPSKLMVIPILCSLK